VLPCGIGNVFGSSRDRVLTDLCDPEVCVREETTMTKTEETYAQDGLTHAPPAPLSSGGYPDQLARLAAFRHLHPSIVIGAVEFGCWQALIPECNGETVRVRHSLKELLDRLAETFGEPALAAGISGLADRASEADVVTEDFGWRWLPGQLTPERWQVSALRCPCGFATDDVREFDGHLVATAGWEPEHFEIAGEWTLEQVRQWQASAAAAGGGDRAGRARADMDARWPESEEMAHHVGIVLPISAGRILAALCGGHQWLHLADLAADEAAWETAVLVVTMESLHAIPGTADEILAHE
jgi:hypothetical protein